MVGSLRIYWSTSLLCTSGPAFTSQRTLTPSRLNSDRIKTIAPGEVITVPTKLTNSYVPFEKALEHTWTSAKPRELKRTPPALWAILSS
jgi:hypothetical protein